MADTTGGRALFGTGAVFLTAISTILGTCANSASGPVWCSPITAW